MNKTETAQLLTIIAAIDHRTLGEADVEAWNLILGDLDVDDCAQAVKEHFTASTDFLMPAHVHKLASDFARRRAGRIRLAQLEQERAAIEAAPLPDDRPVVPLNREKPLKAGHRLEPPDYADRDAMERRRQHFLRELAAMGSQS